MWNVTATRKRSCSSGRSSSAGGALSTSSWANEYGWNQAPCHGSSRLAMMSLRLARADQPGDGVHAARLPGRAGTTGASVGLLASDAVEPHPGQHAVVVCRVRLPAEFATALEPQPVPRADQRAAVHRPGRQVGARDADRSPDRRAACRRRPATPRSPRPPTDVPCGRSRIVSLAANAYQLPLGRRCDRASAASMIAGSASRYVGRLRRPLFARKHCERASSWPRSPPSRSSLLIAQLPLPLREPSQRAGPALRRDGVQHVPGQPETGEQPVGRRPTRRGGAFHQRHGQVDADAVARQHDAADAEWRRSGRAAKSPGANRGQSLRRSSRSSTMRRLCGLRVELVQPGQQPVAQRRRRRRSRRRRAVRRPNRRCGAPTAAASRLVALQHADVVQWWTATRPEERRTVGVHRPVQPQPLHHERRRGCPSPRPAPASRRLRARAKPSTMRRRPATSVANTTPSAVEVDAGVAVHTKPRARWSPRCTDTPVWNCDAARLQVLPQRIPQRHVEVGVRRRRIPGPRSSRGSRCGTSWPARPPTARSGSAKKLRENTSNARCRAAVGKVDVAQEGVGVQMVELLVDRRAPTPPPAARRPGVDPDQIAQPERRAAQRERERVQRRCPRQPAEACRACPCAVDQRVVLDRGQHPTAPESMRRNRSRRL